MIPLPPAMGVLARGGAAAVVAAGWAGGWFETYEGEPRVSLVKFNTDGSIDPDFVADCNDLGEVHDFYYDSARGRLWVCGSFTTINGAAAKRLACLDPDTGALIFDGNLDGTCLTIRPDAGNTYLYCAGGFSGIVGDPDTWRAMRFNLATGARDATWHPVLFNCAVAVPSPFSSEVFLGGNFTTLNGVARVGCGSVDTTDGTTTQAFDPQINSGVVNDICAIDASRIWLTGTFTTLALAARARLAQVDDTGALTAWTCTNPNAVLSGTGNRIRPVTGGALVCGSYASADGATLDGLLNVALDAGDFDAAIQPGIHAAFGSHCHDARRGAASGLLYCATQGGLSDASSQRLIRLLADATIDPAFAPITATSETRQYFRALCLLPAA